MLFHAVGTGTSYRGGPSTSLFGIFTHGALGVDLFFVISGFIIFHSSARARLTPGQFLRRRAERIIPVYWFCTLSLFAITLFAPMAFRSDAVIHAGFLFKSLFFVSFTDNVQPALYVGWSLEFEMFFYLLVAVLMLRARSAYAWHDVIPVLFSLLIVIGLNPAIQDAIGPYKFFTSPYLVEFVLGIIAARIFIGDSIPKPVLITVAACLTAMAIVAQTRAGAMVALTCTAIVFAAAKLSASRRPVSGVERVLERLGDGSYSIYLVQVFTIPAICKAAIKIDPAVPLDLLIAIAASITILAGYGLYLFFEMPALKLCRRMRSAPIVPAPSRT